MKRTTNGKLAQALACLGLAGVVSVVTALSACGGGSKKSADVASPAAVILSDLVASNLASAGFPWDGVSFVGVAKRWDTTTPIPVKTNGEVRAGPAMDAIEAKLGRILFDRTSIAATANSSVTRGIIFSQGTAMAPVGTPIANNCGNVGSAPNAGGYPPGFLVPGSAGVISTVLYLNLDSPVAGGCVASAEVVIHEFGHALGLGAHFAGFGDGPPISTDFWSALATLYGNPIGTPTASMVMVMK